MSHGGEVPFLVECDTGFGRNGVQTPEAALDLARIAMKLPRLRFEGLMTFPNRPRRPRFSRGHSSSSSRRAFPCPSCQAEGRRDLPRARAADAHRASRGDVHLQRRDGGRLRTATWDDCAMRVRATVVSRPTDARAVIDAGTKVLTSDQYTVKGYGHLIEYPEAVVTGLSEEHASSICRLS